MKKLLQMKNISKSFGRTKVLKNVQLELSEGEVLALLGENGAGKSTLMKILGGIHTKDEGKIYMNEKEVEIYNVNDAALHGISIIHQELMLAPHMTIAENVFMGRELTKIRGLVDSKKQEYETQKMLDMFQLKLKANTMLGNLTIAQQQMVEIIRAISFGAKVIVMDEPTSSLSDQEVTILFQMIRNLKEKNVGIIYISHRLNELDEISDKITILRDGEYIDTVESKGIERSQLIAMMVGRELSNFYIKKDNDNASMDTILEVQGLGDGNLVKDVNFSLQRGEILGVSGLVGAGRSEAMKCIFGLTPYEKGTIKFNGKEINFKSPRDAMERGIGFVPENRKEEGLFVQQSVRFNSTITILSKFLKGFSFKKKVEEKIVQKGIDQLQVRAASMEQQIEQLSGGNQQKVIMSRWLNSTNSILILDEPTRGVDIKTKTEIYQLIDKLSKEGISVILISSELPELINLSDRVVVLCHGRTTGVLEREELSQEAIMMLATKDED